MSLTTAIKSETNPNSYRGIREFRRLRWSARPRDKRAWQTARLVALTAPTPSAMVGQRQVRLPEFRSHQSTTERTAVFGGSRDGTHWSQIQPRHRHSSTAHKILLCTFHHVPAFRVQGAPLPGINDNRRRQLLRACYQISVPMVDCSSTTEKQETTCPALICVDTELYEYPPNLANDDRERMLKADLREPRESRRDTEDSRAYAGLGEGCEAARWCCSLELAYIGAVIFHAGVVSNA